jgi:hypothetical protein
MWARTARSDRAPKLTLALALTQALAGGCAPRTTTPPGFPAQSADGSSSPPPEPDPGSNPSQARTFGWFGIALGTEGAIAAAATSAAMLDFKSQRDSDCNARKVCSADGLNANNQIGALAGWNAGAWVLAGAGLGVGTFLLLTHPIDKDRKTSITLAPDGTTAGLGLSGTF